MVCQTRETVFDSSFEINYSVCPAVVGPEYGDNHWADPNPSR